ncbi:Uncharacterised protein [Mycobacteroides abscessus subsp. abscessus]|nr:Uncharacterised protein [Mycobacteroides abscessus subsp. abscessus]
MVVGAADVDSAALGAAEVDVVVVADVEDVEVSLPAAVTGVGASAMSRTVSIT